MKTDILISERSDRNVEYDVFDSWTC